MSRGVGVSARIAEAMEPAEPVVVLVTQLGDLWFLGLLVAALYLLGPAAPLPAWNRRRGAALLAAGLLAVAGTGLLKAVFGLPRPPSADTAAYAFGGILGDVYAWAATADGFGFPSGHAAGSTAVYGTVAGLVASRRRRRALWVAGLVVAAVSLSRVALGVHYLADVLAGVLLGLLLAAVAVRWVRRPTVAIGAAVPAAAGWVVVADGDPEAAGVVGLCVGALVAWAGLDERLSAVRTPGRPALAVMVGLGLAVAGATVVAVETGDRPLAVVGGTVGMAVLVALPLAIERIESASLGWSPDGES